MFLLSILFTYFLISTVKTSAYFAADTQETITLTTLDFVLPPNDAPIIRNGLKINSICFLEPVFPFFEDGILKVFFKSIFYFVEERPVKIGDSINLVLSFIPFNNVTTILYLYYCSTDGMIYPLPQFLIGKFNLAVENFHLSGEISPSKMFFVKYNSIPDYLLFERSPFNEWNPSLPPGRHYLNLYKTTYPFAGINLWIIVNDFKIYSTFNREEMIYMFPLPPPPFLKTTALRIDTDLSNCLSEFEPISSGRTTSRLSGYLFQESDFDCSQPMEFLPSPPPCDLPFSNLLDFSSNSSLNWLPTSMKSPPPPSSAKSQRLSPKNSAAIDTRFTQTLQPFSYQISKEKLIKVSFGDWYRRCFASPLVFRTDRIDGNNFYVVKLIGDSLLKYVMLDEDAMRRLFGRIFDVSSIVDGELAINRRKVRQLSIYRRQTKEKEVRFGVTYSIGFAPVGFWNDNSLENSHLYDGSMYCGERKQEFILYHLKHNSDGISLSPKVQVRICETGANRHLKERIIGKILNVRESYSIDDHGYVWISAPKMMCLR